MTYRSTFLLRSIRELIEAKGWYENRLEGLGNRFINNLYKKIHEIENHPERYTSKINNFREAGIKSFPYLIIYRINKKEKKIVIVSIFHTSRNPSEKYKLK